MVEALISTAGDMASHKCECWFCNTETFGEKNPEVTGEYMMSEACRGHLRALWIPLVNEIWVDGSETTFVYECQLGPNPWVIRAVEPRHYHEHDGSMVICLEKVPVSQIEVEFHEDHWALMQRRYSQEELALLIQSTR